MQLRFATGGAAEGWARVRVAAAPYLLGTGASVLHDVEHDTNTLARYVVPNPCTGPTSVTPW